MTKSDELLILVTNDDGARAPGLLALKECLGDLGQVVVVAPYEERSAASHSLTIHHPLRILELQPQHYAVTGTPVDCVLCAIRKILPRPPDLVVSGINLGANLGDDILYSGTVAAAREAALYRIPALAVSLATPADEGAFRSAASFLRRVLPDLYPQRIPEGTFLNINIPRGELRGFRFTRQGSKLAASSLLEKKDPRGRTYYWIGPDESSWLVEADTDYHAVREQFVSITPLHRDQTDYRTLQLFRETEAEVPGPTRVPREGT